MSVSVYVCVYVCCSVHVCVVCVPHTSLLLCVDSHRGAYTASTRSHSAHVHSGKTITHQISRNSQTHTYDSVMQLRGQVVSCHASPCAIGHFAIGLFFDRNDNVVIALSAPLQINHNRHTPTCIFSALISHVLVFLNPSRTHNLHSLTSGRCSANYLLQPPSLESPWIRASTVFLGV